LLNINDLLETNKGKEHIRDYDFYGTYVYDANDEKIGRVWDFRSLPEVSSIVTYNGEEYIVINTEYCSDGKHSIKIMEKDDYIKSIIVCKKCLNTLLHCTCGEVI
jgi:hypothetical protein